MTVPEETAPATPLAAAFAASAVISKNFGKATAARIPRMTITTTSSMIVNPTVFLIYFPLERRLRADTASTPLDTQVDPWHRVVNLLNDPNKRRAGCGERLAKLARLVRPGIGLRQGDVEAQRLRRPVAR